MLIYSGSCTINQIYSGGLVSGFYCPSGEMHTKKIVANINDPNELPQYTSGIVSGHISAPVESKKKDEFFLPPGGLMSEEEKKMFGGK